MSAQDEKDGTETYQRIGSACDRLSRAGLSTLHGVVVRDLRQRRGRIKQAVHPRDLATDLMDIAEDLERLATHLEAHPLPARAVEVKEPPLAVTVVMES